MRAFACRSLLLSCCLGLSSCATQGYPGSELSPEQTANVSLPAPFIALLPLFWIFPLNLVARLADDWHETVNYDIQVDNIELNRFISASVLSGKHQTYATRHFSSATLIGSENCSSYDTRSKDKNGKETCTRTSSCVGEYRVAEWQHFCSLTFKADAGHRYLLLVNHEKKFMVRDAENPQMDQSGDCHWSDYHYHNETRSNSGTSNC